MMMMMMMLMMMMMSRCTMFTGRLESCSVRMANRHNPWFIALVVFNVLTLLAVFIISGLSTSDNNSTCNVAAGLLACLLAFLVHWFKQSLFTFMKIWTIKIIV